MDGHLQRALERNPQVTVAAVLLALDAESLHAGRYELQSKLLKGGLIGGYTGDYYRGYEGGY